MSQTQILSKESGNFNFLIFSKIAIFETSKLLEGKLCLGTIDNFLAPSGAITPTSILILAAPFACRIYPLSWGCYGLKYEFMKQIRSLFLFNFQQPLFLSDLTKVKKIKRFYTKIQLHSRILSSGIENPGHLNFKII